MSERREIHPAVAVLIGFAVVAAVGFVVFVAWSQRQPAVAATAVVVTAVPVESPTARAARLAASWRSQAPAARETGLRKCFAPGGFCDADETRAIVGGGASDRERSYLRRMSGALYAQSQARMAVDGATVSEGQVVAASAGIVDASCSVIRGLGLVPIGEALKDPDKHRGASISVTGDVVQIERVGDTFRGTLKSAAGTVYFVVVGKTDGVVPKSRGVTVTGVFVQKYWYTNAMGGQTESALIVGRLEGQDDADPPLPK